MTFSEHLKNVCFKNSLDFYLLIKAYKDETEDISLNVRKTIIPAIIHLQKLEPQVALAAVLGEDLIIGRLSSLKLGVGVLCSSLKESDFF